MDSVPIAPFLNKINEVIINPLLILLFAVAALIFFYGVFEFVRSASEASERKGAKDKIIWGLVGMFVMFSAFGIIGLLLDTFGIDSPRYITF